jgi:hypothetical protein
MITKERQPKCTDLAMLIERGEARSNGEAPHASDYPVVVHLACVYHDQRRKGGPHYEIMWEKDLSLPNILKQAWDRRPPNGDLGLVWHPSFHFIW